MSVYKNKKSEVLCFNKSSLNKLIKELLRKGANVHDLILSDTKLLYITTGYKSFLGSDLFYGEFAKIVNLIFLRYMPIGEHKKCTAQSNRVRNKPFPLSYLRSSKSLCCEK